jgi:hypothetical protein
MLTYADVCCICRQVSPHELFQAISVLSNRRYRSDMHSDPAEFMTWVCMYVCLYVCLYVCIYIYVHTYIYIYMYHIYIYICICICKCISIMCVCMYVITSIYICIAHQFAASRARGDERQQHHSSLLSGAGASEEHKSDYQEGRR